MKLQSQNQVKNIGLNKLFGININKNKKESEPFFKRFELSKFVLQTSNLSCQLTSRSEKVLTSD